MIYPEKLMRSGLLFSNYYSQIIICHTHSKVEYRTQLWAFNMLQAGLKVRGNLLI